jgi:hypothetical protein
MTSENKPLEFIRDLCFDRDDFFDQQKMIDKLDQLILAWGKDLLRSQYIDRIPDSESAWLEVLERDIYWKDLKNQWDFYLVGCLVFFVLMREDIKGIFCCSLITSRGKDSSDGCGG